MAEIPATPADGNFLALIVPAIADTSAPSLVELNAAGVVDISCYLTASGWSPSLSEQVIADERLCSTQTFEKKGRSQRTLDIQYIDNTNSPDETLYNKAKDTLVPGSKHFLVTRGGLSFDAAKAVGQKFSIRPVEAGEYNELPPEANSVFKIGQKMFINGTTVIDAVAVA